MCVLEDASYVSFLFIVSAISCLCCVYLYAGVDLFYPIACSTSADAHFDRVTQPFVSEQNLQKNLEWFVVHGLIICPSEAFWSKLNGPSFIAVNNKSLLC